MTYKFLEIRDRATFIPVLAIRPEAESGVQDFYLRRSGYGPSNRAVILLRLADSKAASGPYDWGAVHGRTMRAAHEYIEHNFDRLMEGEVVDVEYILGERARPKTSERLGPYAVSDPQDR